MSSPRRGRALKIVSLTAGTLVIIALVAVWTAPGWLIPWLERHYPGCLYRVPTRQKMVALTIDDGPDPGSTPAILDQLRRHGARATFFLIASRVKGESSVMDRLVREGHQLGNHFARDRASIRLSRQEFEADLLAAHRALSPWGHPVWARPGSGWYSKEMLGIMKQHLYRCALGSIYPLDAAIPSVTWATQYILRHLEPGAIVILHDGGSRGKRTARTLAKVLPELSRRGFQVVTLSELMRSTAPPAAPEDRIPPGEGRSESHAPGPSGGRRTPAWP
jgi:peptidoglycan-N-acetylglucosamine deacetylase